MPDLAFHYDQAIAIGRARALAVWNKMPTDFPLGDGTYAPLATSSAMVDDAAHAYAIIEQCARIDGLKMPFYAGGAQPVEGDPVPNLLKSLPSAMQTVKDYARWVAETKPLRSAKGMRI